MKNNRITKRQAEQIFKTEILPSVIQRYEQDGIIDRLARREAWHNFTDMLCRDGQITLWQYENWTSPVK